MPAFLTACHLSVTHSFPSLRLSGSVAVAGRACVRVHPARAFISNNMGARAPGPRGSPPGPPHHRPTARLYIHLAAGKRVIFRIDTNQFVHTHTHTLVRGPRCFKLNVLYVLHFGQRYKNTNNSNVAILTAFSLHKPTMCLTAHFWAHSSWPTAMKQIGPNDRATLFVTEAKWTGRMRAANQKWAAA